MLEILIKNGRIVDGSGNPWFKGDVLVKGEKIAKDGGNIAADAELVIDAQGLIVSPGFIDVHTL